MHDSDDVVLAECLQHLVGVPDVAPDNGTPFDEVWVPGREIVEANRLKARLEQRLATMRSDVAGAARHQNRRMICHFRCPYPRPLSPRTMHKKTRLNIIIWPSPIKLAREREMRFASLFQEAPTMGRNRLTLPASLS